MEVASHDLVPLMSLVSAKANLIPIAASFVLTLAGGCTHTPPARNEVRKATSQPLYQAPPDRVQTSPLLDFASSLDTTFVESPSVRIADDPASPGNRVLVADGGVRLNLTSLVRGRDVGGMWDVIGVRIWADVATTCELQLAGGPTAVGTSTRADIPARAWTTLWLAFPANSTAGGTPATRAVAMDQLSLLVKPASTARSRLLLDDVVLAQSHVTVSASSVPKTNEPWRIVRDGMKWLATIDGRTLFDLPAAPFAANGYRVLESDPTRALFIDPAGSTLCIDRTGRLIENGHAKLDSRVLKVAKAIAENASPASIEIVGDAGRIEQSLPGDADNDGYDERRGCYAVHAANGQVAFRLRRRQATVKWPAIEVYDLPPGPVSVWLDGEMIPWAVRAEDGRLIVELPIELQGTVEVQIRVK